jgi:hypothetical protein
MRAYFSARDLKSLKNSKKFWSIYKAIIRTKSSSSFSFSFNTLKDVNGEPYGKLERVVMAFNKHFGSIHHL